MNLNNPWVYEELAKLENNTYLTDKLMTISSPCHMMLCGKTLSR